MAGALDEDATHGQGGGGEEMSAPVPLPRLAVAGHPQVGLVDDYVTAREALIAAVRGLSVGWDAILEQHWRAAITAIVVPMLEGAAVHTALFAEQLATTGDPLVDA